MENQNIIINQEFEKLIPPLSKEEFEQLEKNILADGIRDALVTWNNFLLDGHNRLKIAEKHSLKYSVAGKNFEDEEAAKIWMIDNQQGRRNLSDGWKFELAIRRKECLKEVGKETQGKRSDLLSLNDKKLPEHNTRKLIADELGWSTGKVAMAEIVMQKAPDVWQKVKDNDIPITTAYKEVKQEERKTELKEQRDLAAEFGSKKSIEIDFRLGDFETVFTDINDGSVDCIITDPPYAIEHIECWTKLSRFAKRVLKPNGFCIAYSGQMNLPEVFIRMCEHMDYYWTFAVYHEGQTQIISGRNVMCRWKPVLIFQNGKKKLTTTFQDYFISEAREKDGHDWQQSKSGVAYLIEMFTQPNELIIDPFAGSGTTLIVAKQKNRQVKGAELNKETFNIAKSMLWQTIPVTV